MIRFCMFDEEGNMTLKVTFPIWAARTIYWMRFRKRPWIHKADQWTPEEIALLKDRDAPPLEINKIKKSNIVDEIEAFFQDKP